MDSGDGLVTQSCPTLQSRGLYPARLLCPWNSPGKNTGLGCHFLLQWVDSRTKSRVGQIGGKKERKRKGKKKEEKGKVKKRKKMERKKRERK